MGLDLIVLLFTCSVPLDPALICLAAQSANACNESVTAHMSVLGHVMCCNTPSLYCCTAVQYLV